MVLPSGPLGSSCSLDSSRPVCSYDIGSVIVRRVLSFVSKYDTKIGTKNGQARIRVALLANDDVVGHVVLW